MVDECARIVCWEPYALPNDVRLLLLFHTTLTATKYRHGGGNFARGGFKLLGQLTRKIRLEVYHSSASSAATFSVPLSVSSVVVDAEVAADDDAS